MTKHKQKVEPPKPPMTQEEYDAWFEKELKDTFERYAECFKAMA